jgi:hypothetical protein
MTAKAEIRELARRVAALEALLAELGAPAVGRWQPTPQPVPRSWEDHATSH